MRVCARAVSPDAFVNVCAVRVYGSEYLSNCQCSACPTHSTSAAGSTSSSACVCNAGYSKDGSLCNACAEDTYKSSSDTSCLSCPSYSSSPSASMSHSDCLCNAGYSGPDGQTCGICSAGKYKTSAGAATCSNCPEGTSSPQGSTQLNACTCLSGYTGSSDAGGVTCSECTAGKYKVSETSCSSCPSNSDSPSASSSAADCACNAG